MPSRIRDMVRPRTLALLLAGLAGGYVASRVGGRTAPAGREERVPEPDWFPAPALGLAILAACGLFVAGSLGWAALASQAQARAVAVALTGGEPDRAPPLLVRYGCAGCHTIPGVPGADGKVAGPLAGLRARTYVGGVLPNTAGNLVGWIVDPPAYSPRTAMPVTGITQAEARDVAAYLYTPLTGAQGGAEVGRAGRDFT